MTILDIITHVDQLKPNGYQNATKIGWLSNLDGQIFRDVIATHEGAEITEFNGYDEESLDKELLVPYPFDEDIYTYYLQAQIDKENGEIKKYNNSITQYNNAFLAYANWYNRNHTPKAKVKRFRF